MKNSITLASRFAETGKMITVTFIKNDGTIRTLNGRTGVKKYLKGGADRSADTKDKYLLIWTRCGSRFFDAPRNIARNMIVSIRCDGIEIERNNKSAFARFI